MANRKRELAVLWILVCTLGFSMAHAEQVVFTEDFEASADWCADNGLWEVGEPVVGPSSAHGGVQCACTVLAGNYPAYTTSRISPTVRLPSVGGGEELALSF